MGKKTCLHHMSIFSLQIPIFLRKQTDRHTCSKARSCIIISLLSIDHYIHLYHKELRTVKKLFCPHIKLEYLSICWLYKSNIAFTGKLKNIRKKYRTNFIHPCLYNTLPEESILTISASGTSSKYQTHNRKYRRLIK